LRPAKQIFLGDSSPVPPIIAAHDRVVGLLRIEAPNSCQIVNCIVFDILFIVYELQDMTDNYFELNDSAKRWFIVGYITLYLSRYWPHTGGERFPWLR